jgi:hypothetical protein
MYVPCPSYTLFRVLTIIKNDNTIKNDTYNFGQCPGHFAKALLAIRKKESKPAAAMGSYGDRLLNCVACGLEGKCMLDEFLNGAEPLTDCGFAGRPLCQACLYATEPEDQAKKLAKEQIAMQPREEQTEQAK